MDIFIYAPTILKQVSKMVDLEKEFNLKSRIGDVQ